MPIPNIVSKKLLSPIKVVSRSTEPGKFSEAISSVDNTRQVPGFDINTLKNPIPNIIHYIWLGDKPMPATGVSNIIHTAKLNPHHQVILWTDNPNKIKNELIERGLSQALFSRISVQVPDLKGKVAAAVARECTDTNYRNYAAASDIVRLAVLEQYGGIYMDEDVPTYGPIPYMGVWKYEEADCVFLHRIAGGSVSNCVMAAPHPSKDIKKLLDIAVKSYENTSHLAEIMWKDKRSELKDRRKYTLETTGPTFIANISNTTEIHWESLPKLPSFFEIQKFNQEYKPSLKERPKDKFGSWLPGTGLQIDVVSDHWTKSRSIKRSASSLALHEEKLTQPGTRMTKGTLQKPTADD